MRTAETVSALTEFRGRGAGTDAERRAALWLAAELQSADRNARLEPFWCRPNWAFAHAWHTVLALAGSLVSVHSPRVGGVLLVVALLSVIADERLGFSLGRRLTPERASQNVVATPASCPQGDATPVHLIITANYDAGRTGWAYRDWLRRPFARLNEALGGRAPGWLAWLLVAMAWLVAIAILRLEGERGTLVGILQLIPTAALVIALALLLELGSAPFSPAAGDNATGVAVALALASALDAAPPQNLTVEVVLQGAGDAFGIGLRRHLRVRRRELHRANAVVLGIAPSAVGAPRWWLSDGQLAPLRYLRRLAELCAGLEASIPAAGPRRGRGATPALRARSAGLPAISIGAAAPRTHRHDDTPKTVEPSALDGVLQFGLMLADEIDGAVLERRSDRGHRISLRRPLAVLSGGEGEPPDQL